MTPTHPNAAAQSGTVETELFLIGSDFSEKLAAKERGSCGPAVVLADFAVKLERDRDALREILQNMALYLSGAIAANDHPMPTGTLLLEQARAALAASSSGTQPTVSLTPSAPPSTSGSGE